MSKDQQVNEILAALQLDEYGEKGLKEIIRQMAVEIVKRSEPEQELIAKYREGYKKGFLDGAEPESEQKPLSGKEISHGFRCDDDATNAESYWAGVEYAEKHYGIGVDDEDEARNTN